MSNVRLGPEIIALIACPHEWIFVREVLVDRHKKKGNGLSEAKRFICQRCHSHRFLFADGSADLVSADSLAKEDVA